MEYRNLQPRWGSDKTMRRFCLGLILILCGPAFADGDQILLDRDSLKSQLEGLRQRVEVAEKLLHGDRLDARKAALEFTALKEELGDLIRKTIAARSVDSVGQVGAKAGNNIVTSAVYVSPIGDASLRIVLERISKEQLPDGKLRVLKDASANTFFLADQCIKVTGVFPSIDDRLRALELVTPRMLDRQNAQRVLIAFPFAEERERARNTIARIFAAVPAPLPTTSP